MQKSIKSILNATVIVCTALWVLNVFGALHYLSRMQVGR